MFSPEFETQLLNWFISYAYQPEMVYFGIVAFMFASSFGLPLPEEVVLLSAGVVAHIAAHPELYPKPYPEADGVNLIFTAGLCFFAVFFSDLVVYGVEIGRAHV